MKLTNGERVQHTATIRPNPYSRLSGQILPGDPDLADRPGVPLSDLDRPDLWHVAMAIGDTGRIGTQAARNQAKADILNTWHMAAELQRLALEQENTIRNLEETLAHSE
jgi:hypothetical protein